MDNRDDNSPDNLEDIFFDDLESEEESEKQQEREGQKLIKEREKLARAAAEQDLASQGDAVIGAAGGALFLISMLAGWGATPIIIAIVAIGWFIRCFLKRKLLWNYVAAAFIAICIIIGLS